MPTAITSPTTSATAEPSPSFRSSWAKEKKNAKAQGRNDD